MAAQPTTIEPLANPPAAVAYLDSAREAGAAEPSELETLRTRLTTERSASAALIAALAELEQRLADAQEQVKAQHRDYARLSYELNHVVRQLADAQRPLWRKVLGRRSVA